MFDGRSSDLELNWLTQKYGSEWEEWRKLGAQWLDQQESGLSSKSQALIQFFETYLIDTTPWESSVCVFFDGYQGHRCSSDEFIQIILQKTNRSDNRDLSNLTNQIADFLDWVLDTHFSEPNDHGVPVRLWLNPFVKVKQQYKLTETVHNPLPYRYIQELRQILCQKPDGCFKDWLWAQQQLDSGKKSGDWFEVDPERIDQNDLDCVWRTKEVLRGNRKVTIYQLWSPVRAMVLYLKLQLPLRTYQVRMLDSGEADTWRYDGGQWVENTVHSFALGNVRRPYEKGVFRRIYDNMTAQYSTGIFVSTNKTADQNKDEQTKGYVIPWQHGEVLYWLQKLREWQEKYNSIQAPASATSLFKKHTSSLKSQQQLSAMGSFCFLFRDAAAKGEDRIKPIISGKAELLWCLLLKTLEDQLFAQGDTLSNGQPLKLVNDYPEDYQGSKKTTLFPLHSLRVSLISAYALEGKVPLPVISKLLAGHSRLLMTLYYIRITPSTMASKMEEAHQHLEANEEQSLRGFLQDADLSQIQAKMVYHDSSSLDVALNTRNPAGWVGLHHGLCLMGANTSQTVEPVKTLGGCWNGGSLIKDSKNPELRIYGSVPHGNPSNCVRCRWFVTSSRYLGSPSILFF